MSRAYLISCALSVSLSTGALAETVYVPDHAATIQAAIDKVDHGDTVIVRAGTYYERINFLGKDITVRSEDGPETTIIDAESAGTGVAMGSGRLEGFVITHADDTGVFIWGSATMIDCIVRDNLGSEGGGVHVYGGDPTISRCHIVQNTGATFAGGVYLEPGSAPTITECDFEGNHGESGLASGLYSWSHVTIDRCVFVENDGVAVSIAEAYAGKTLITGSTFSRNIGVGIRYHGFSLNGDIELSDCRFVENQGGAASLFGLAGAVTVADCDFVGHPVRALGLSTESDESVEVERSLFASNTGGAVAVGYSTVARFDDCSFFDNTADVGGALYLGSVQGTSLADCVFISNRATNDGGAVWTGTFSPSSFSRCCFVANAAGGDGGAIAGQTQWVALSDCVVQDNLAARGGGMYSGSLDLTRCVIRGNTALEEGGGICAASTLRAVGCVFDTNSAVTGGGLRSTASESSLASSFVNCLFNRNTADVGGGASLDTPNGTGFVNTTFFGNVAASAGGALSCGESNELSLANCILWGNDAPVGKAIHNGSVGATRIGYSDIQACGGSGAGWDDALGIDDGGNIDVDPSFVGPPQFLRLASDSPCIDAADNTAVPEGTDEDLDGRPRFVDDPDTGDTGHGSPPIVDMGPYEFQAVPCTGDLDDDGAVGFSDVLAVLAAWGECEGCPEDLDGDGVVGFSDVLVVLAAWGPCSS